MTRIPANVSGPIGLSPAVIVPNLGSSTADVVNTTLANRNQSDQLLSTYLQTSSNERIANQGIGLEDRKIAAQMFEVRLQDTAKRDDLASRLDYNQYVTDLNYRQNDRILGEEEFRFRANRKDNTAKFQTLVTEMDKLGMVNWSKYVLGQLATLQASKTAGLDKKNALELRTKMFQDIQQQSALDKKETQMTSSQVTGMNSLITQGNPSDILRSIEANPFFNTFNSPDEMISQIQAGKLDPIQLRIAGKVAVEGATTLVKRMRDELGPEKTNNLRDAWNLLITSGKFKIADFSSLGNEDLITINEILSRKLPEFSSLFIGDKKSFINDLIKWGPGFDALTKLTQVGSNIYQVPVGNESPVVISTVQVTRGGIQGTSKEKLASQIETEAMNPDGTFDTDKVEEILQRQLDLIFGPDGTLSDHPLAPLYSNR